MWTACADVYGNARVMICEAYVTVSRAAPGWLASDSLGRIVRRVPIWAVEAAGQRTG